MSGDIPLERLQIHRLTAVPWPEPDPTQVSQEVCFVFFNQKSFHYLSLEAFLNWYYDSDL